MTLSKLNIAKEFVVLNQNKKASIERNDEGLYKRLDEKYNSFKGCELISSYEFDCDWNSWEMHPSGDEIVLLLSGKVDFILQYDTEEKVVSLEEPGSYIIVPQNIWHTAKTQIKAKLLFITPGEGTQHKPLE